MLYDLFFFRKCVRGQYCLNLDNYVKEDLSRDTQYDRLTETISSI